MAGLGWAGLGLGTLHNMDQGWGSINRSGPRWGRCQRAAALLCPCKRPLGKGSSVGTAPQSPRVYKQGTTLGQAVKGRDSLSLPGMQLDPAGTWAVPGTRRVAQPGGLLGQRVCVDGSHGGKGPTRPDVNIPCLSTAAPWGCPGAGTMSLCQALFSPVSPEPQPLVSSPCPQPLLLPPRSEWPKRAPGPLRKHP